MQPSIFFGLLLAIRSLGLAQASSSSAPIIQSNPSGAKYQALLQSAKLVQGMVEGVSSSNGTGVNFNISLFDFPDVPEGPFLYHIHELPVPDSGNCTATGAHFDPYLRGESPVCNPSAPSTCQLGDLSGKHGTIQGSSFMRFYLDLYLSTEPGNEAFFGNRSIVIHSANKTRLNCANFVLISGPNTISSSITPASASSTALTTSEVTTKTTAVGSKGTASVSVGATGAPSEGGAVLKIVIYGRVISAAAMAVVAAMAAF